MSILRCSRFNWIPLLVFSVVPQESLATQIRRTEVQSLQVSGSGNGNYAGFLAGKLFTCTPGALDDSLVSYKLAENGWMRDASIPTPVSSNGISQFSASFTSDADDVAIGYPFAPSSMGAVWVVSFDVEGNESSQALIPNPGQASDLFGASVAVAGEDLFVSAINFDGPISSRSGAVYHYRKAGSTWQLFDTLAPSPSLVTGPSFRFGIELTLAAGDLYITSKGSFPTGFGRVDHFARDTSGRFAWISEVAPPLPTNSSDSFGNCVATQGNTLAVASSVDLGSKGRVHVYTRPHSSANWVYTQTIRSSLPGANSWNGDTFGESIAFAEDYLWVGDSSAPGRGSSRGAVYGFRLRSTQFYSATEDVILTKRVGSSNTSGFGARVALDGDMLLASFLAVPAASTGAFQVFSLDDSPRICSGMQKVGTNGARVDILMSASGLPSDATLLLSGTEEASAYVVLGSLSTTISPSSFLHKGGLCLSGPSAVLVRGTVSADQSIAFREVGEFTQRGQILFGVLDTIYLQAALLHSSSGTSFSECIRARLR